mgnify:CR=1 FL=1
MKTVVIGGSRAGGPVEWNFEHDKVGTEFYRRVEIALGDSSYYVYKLDSMSDREALDDLLLSILLDTSEVEVLKHPEDEGASSKLYQKVEIRLGESADYIYKSKEVMDKAALEELLFVTHLEWHEEGK